jgi:hypothetical protein
MVSADEDHANSRTALNRGGQIDGIKLEDKQNINEEQKEEEDQEDSEEMT